MAADSIAQDPENSSKPPLLIRRLQLPAPAAQSFFLWGARQTGKTTLLKQTYPDARRINLLNTDQLLKYTREPFLLRQELLAQPPGRFTVIDEIQKVPLLLNEVHTLIEEHQQIFALCGSSARQLKGHHVNLLGGRALRFELHGLSAMEIGAEFDLEKLLNHGTLPNHYQSKNPRLAIKSYIDDYLRTEILEEGLTRNLPVFADFLRVAAIGDTAVLNISNVARESGVSTATARGYYDILQDTLSATLLPAYTHRQKRRTVHAPKFYFHDVGVVNHISQRQTLTAGSELFGKAFENWLHHEITLHAKYTEQFYPLSYWRLSSGAEVDFVMGDGIAAIEAKAKTRIQARDLQGLIQFGVEMPAVKHKIIVALVDQPRKTTEGILILPYQDFLQRLWANEFIH